MMVTQQHNPLESCSIHGVDILQQHGDESLHLPNTKRTPRLLASASYFGLPLVVAVCIALVTSRI